MLLIVDEADRLKLAGLEQLRYYFDRHPIGLILIGMPGSRSASRATRSSTAASASLTATNRSAPTSCASYSPTTTNASLTLSADDFTDSEAVAAVARITNGNFRLVHRLFAQITRILDINQLTTVTSEVVQAARDALVIGQQPLQEHGQRALEFAALVCDLEG